MSLAQVCQEGVSSSGEGELGAKRTSASPTALTFLDKEAGKGI